MTLATGRSIRSLGCARKDRRRDASVTGNASSSRTWSIYFAMVDPGLVDSAAISDAIAEGAPAMSATRTSRPFDSAALVDYEVDNSTPDSCRSARYRSKPGTDVCGRLRRCSQR